MDSTDSFTELVRRLKTGDDALVNELFQRYARRLIGLAYNSTVAAASIRKMVQSVYKVFSAGSKLSRST